MSVTEKNALMRAKDVTGNSFLIYPVTKAENVDGLDALLLDKADSKDLAEVATSGSWNDLLDKPQGSPVLYDQPQTLTPEQRAMANDNICMRMYDWHTLSSESVPENMRSLLDVQWSPAANATQAINYADPDALLAVTGGKLYGTNDVTYDCSAMHQFAYHIGVVPRLNQIYMDKISENVEHVIEAYELMASQVENNTHGDPITFAILPDSYTRFARYSGYVRRETHTDGVTHYIGYDAGSVREGSITWNDDTKTLVSYTLAYPHISSSGKYTTGLAADAATVKADLDNKISIPATSEAGQLLSVKSVDESGKPAEFEAVDADYYTEVEIDSKLSEINTAIAGKSESGHNHDDKYATKTELNSAADQATTYINSELAKKASKDELTTHTSNTTSHITSTERTNWNAAKTHADSAHAPSNAEKNQNAFSNVAVGSTTIAADSATDTLTLAGSNVTITPDATNDKVTIGITKANVTSALGYTPPTTNTTYSAATTSAAGLMSASDKSKLDGIASGATNITVDTALSSSSTNPVQNNVINTALDSKANTDHAHDNYMTKSNPTGTGSVSIGRDSNTVIGLNSVAMGNYTAAIGSQSFAMGSYTSALGPQSVALGCLTNAKAEHSTAMGNNTTSSGSASTALGCLTNASGEYSTTSGYYTNAKAKCSTATGFYTNANGDYSTAIGYYTISEMLQFVAGRYNTNISGPTTVNKQDSTNSDALFLIGHGVNINGVLTRANAFRVTSGGKCFGTTAFGASGADFAELFEWTDGNPNNEDRRGLFVALDGEKIKIANEGDDYIGVISGAQAFIGNSASEEWQGKYMTDVFGERLAQEVDVPEVVDEETGEVITPATTTTQYVVNPDYDPDRDYTMRENRKEWGIVGLLGQIVMIDDGTCVVGGHVKPSANGIGTASDSGYRVMKRIDENHIKVLVK